MGEWPWNLAGVFVLGICVCVPSFMALWLRDFEKTHLGGFSPFAMWGFSSNFHLSFLEFKFCFSTSKFWIEFLCLLMTGANNTKAWHGMVEFNAAHSKSAWSGEFSDCNNTTNTSVHALQEKLDYLGMAWVGLPRIEDICLCWKWVHSEVFEAGQYIGENVGKIYAFGFQSWGARNNARTAWKVSNYHWWVDRGQRPFYRNHGFISERLKGQIQNFVAGFLTNWRDKPRRSGAIWVSMHYPGTKHEDRRQRRLLLDELIESMDDSFDALEKYVHMNSTITKN